MMIDKDSLSFGRYLKRIRLEKGISLEEISRETRVGVDLLLLIEKEEHTRLPAEVFVKGFLRAYAKFIGADEAAAVQRYLSSRRVFEESVEFSADLMESTTKFWPRFLFSLGALSLMIILVVFITPLFQQQTTMEDSSTPAVVRKDTPDMTTHDIGRSIGDKKDVGSISDKLLLRIVTTEETWIKVTIDAHDPKEYSLNPGDRLELEASSNFDLSIGNAGGVQLMLNETPVDVAGKSGQVVNIKIP